MSKAKRLRKARQQMRGTSRTRKMLGDDLLQWRRRNSRLIRVYACRYGPESVVGRNPKVLAKRRRQRERLAEQAVLDSYGWLDLLAMLEEPERDERGCWRIHRNMASERAERLHAIAEGR